MTRKEWTAYLLGIGALIATVVTRNELLILAAVPPLIYWCVLVGRSSRQRQRQLQEIIDDLDRYQRGGEQ